MEIKLFNLLVTAVIAVVKPSSYSVILVLRACLQFTIGKELKIKVVELREETPEHSSLGNKLSFLLSYALATAFVVAINGINIFFAAWHLVAFEIGFIPVDNYIFTELVILSFFSVLELLGCSIFWNEGEYAYFTKKLEEANLAHEVEMKELRREAARREAEKGALESYKKQIKRYRSEITKMLSESNKDNALISTLKDRNRLLEKQIKVMTSRYEGGCGWEEQCTVCSNFHGASYGEEGNETFFNCAMHPYGFEGHCPDLSLKE